jgi:hypothetical protein
MNLHMQSILYELERGVAPSMACEHSLVEGHLGPSLDGPAPAALAPILRRATDRTRARPALGARGPSRRNRSLSPLVALPPPPGTTASASAKPTLEETTRDAGPGVRDRRQDSFHIV